MTERISPRQFHEAVGVEDWRVLLFFDGAWSEDLVDPHGRGPSFWFQQMKEWRQHSRTDPGVGEPTATACRRGTE